jgi:transposase
MCSIVGMQKRYIINLSDEERVALQAVVAGRRGLPQRRRAQILLKVDEGLCDAEVAEEVGVAHRTVERVRERCCTRGLVAAVETKPPERPRRLPKLDGTAQAQLVQLACSEPPNGRARWTLSLLANKMVELKIVDEVSRTTIHRELKKTF